MNYNIHIAASHGKFNVFDLNEIQLHKVVRAYSKGERAFTLSGQTYYFGDTVGTFRIFSNASQLSSSELKKAEIEYGSGHGVMSGTYFTIDDLLRFGREVTDEIIGDASFGCDAETVAAPNAMFINQTRITELENLNGRCRYDLSKLVTLCVEINDNYMRHNYYSVALLLRTLLNHVPPAFNGKDSFDQVLAELNGPRHKTRREILSRLHDLQRKFADLTTHERLREFEPQITKQQVSFLPEIDYLLQEVTIGLKTG